MIELGVDEITVVLQLSSNIKDNIKPSEWYVYAKAMIDIFVDLADFKAIFGDIRFEDRPPEGYTNAYSFGEHNFYLAAAYHNMRIDMGVVIKFSAQALDYYIEQSGLRVYQLMKIIQDDTYTTRLSRVDLTVDYIDEDIDVTNIYQNLIDKKVAVFREVMNRYNGVISLIRADLAIKGFVVENEIPTVYLGSAQSNARLRIYDKKREQIERFGSKLNKAKACDNWIRFEGIFRHEFAHQIGDALLTIDDDDEFANLIANVMIQKFRMMVIDKGVIVRDTVFTKMLLNCKTNNCIILSSPSSRNYELAKSLKYLFEGSGVITSLYKVRSIWGEDALKDILAFIRKYIKVHAPNDDCRYWLERNESDYRKNYPDFDVFMKENVKKEYMESEEL